MKKKNRVILIVFVIFFILVLLTVLFIPKTKNEVCFKEKCFSVEVADTPGEQERGLMDRTYLAPEKGMLFAFEKEGNYSFWMKNTLINLDIIWMNENKEIVYVAKNQTPCINLECPWINPTEQGKYVLEINAGESNELDIGERAVILI